MAAITSTTLTHFKRRLCKNINGMKANSNATFCFSHSSMARSMVLLALSARLKARTTLIPCTYSSTAPTSADWAATRAGEI